MPIAIQYGMSLNEFWYGDTRLLNAYQIAYMRNKSYTAWLNGAYIFEATSKANMNVNRAKKSDPVQNYDKWKDPTNNQKVKKKNINYEQEHHNQQMWFYNMVNNI